MNGTAKGGVNLDPLRFAIFIRFGLSGSPKKSSCESVAISFFSHCFFSILTSANDVDYCSDHVNLSYTMGMMHAIKSSNSGFAFCIFICFALTTLFTAEYLKGESLNESRQQKERNVPIF